VYNAGVVFVNAFLYLLMEEALIVGSVAIICQPLVAPIESVYSWEIVPLMLKHDRLTLLALRDERTKPMGLLAARCVNYRPAVSWRRQGSI
jgi:hypothetical protein